MRRRRDQPLRLRFLGGLSAVAALALTPACDDGKTAPPAPRARSQAVAATGSTAPSEPAAAPTPSASIAAAPKAPRQLCAGQLTKPGSALSREGLEAAAAAGVAKPPAELKLGKGWTWINLWAAWCKPCKEEMPRLRSWEKKLAAEGKPFAVVFVSMDDDERQLEGFLKDQPEGGVRQTYWLREGDDRTKWLTSVGLEEDPELPAHVLVDGSGKVRCRFVGAVEDSDYENVSKLVGS